jgi:hypothetical protein
MNCTYVTPCIGLFMLCCAMLCYAMWVPNVSQIFEISFSPQYSNEFFFLIFYFLGVFFILTERFVFRSCVRSPYIRYHIAVTITERGEFPLQRIFNGIYVRDNKAF